MKEACDCLYISRDIMKNRINKEVMSLYQKRLLWRLDINEVDEWMKIKNREKHKRLNVRHWLSVFGDGILYIF